MAEQKNIFNVSKNRYSDISKNMYNVIMQMPIAAIYVKHKLDNKIVCCNKDMLDFLSCNEQEFEEIYKNFCFELFVDEDVNLIKSTIDDAYASHSDMELECKIKCKSEEIKWAKVKVQFQKEDAQDDMIIYFFDIGQYKLVESQMVKEREQYKQILNINSNIFFEYDIEEDTITFKNADTQIKLAGQKIKNFKKRIVNTKKVYQQDKEKIISIINSHGTKEVEFRYISIDGNLIWCQICAVTLRDENDNPKTVVGCINNIDRQKKEEEKHIERAKQDSLTKVYNANYIKKYINKYLMSEGKMGMHAFLIVDINEFCKINERLGSLFGDAILINVADNLKKILEAKDIVGRVGGDEFVLFIKDAYDGKYLKDKISEINQIVRNTYIGENNGDEINCNIGVALYPTDGRKYEALFRNADWALHQAKLQGKGQTMFYDKTALYDGREIADNEFYNDYKIINDNNRRMDAYDREITAFAFDIMSRTKDVNSAIKLILDRIGKRLDASYVTIYECDFVNKNIISTYQWNKEGVKKRDKEYIDMYEGVYENYIGRFKNSQLFCSSDTSKLSGTYVFSEVLEDNYIKAFMQSAIYDNDKIVGCISVSDINKARKWSKADKDSLATISRVVSTYLLKMRASQRMEDKLNHIKNFDPLTGISTVHRFKKQVREIIDNNPDKQYVIVNSDFDKFKYINDIIGYDAGDDLLKSFAEFISEEANMNLCCCRVYSDDYLAMFEFLDEDTIVDYIERLSAVFTAKVKKKYVNINLTISSGASIIDRNNSDIMTTIDNANAARKAAKDVNDNCCVFFNDQMREKIRIEFEIISNMEKALAYNEFKVYYQPKVSLATGNMVGAEALVRWVKADGSIMPPDKFIPLFEKNGFVVNLDFFVYREVCKSLREWIDKGLEVVPISVNVSRIHLYDETFIGKFIKLVDEYELPYEIIELELTESMFLDNTNVAISTMRQFRELGFKVSIDDFGAGYSSLNLLKEMTSDVLKLDKEFFGRGELQKEEQIIVSSIVNMAKQLDMKVLSEGIETEEQVEFLKGIACDMAQGYLFARPMPKDNFENIIKEKLKFGM